MAAAERLGSYVGGGFELDRGSGWNWKDSRNSGRRTLYADAAFRRIGLGLGRHTLGRERKSGGAQRSGTNCTQVDIYGAVCFF